VDMLMPRAPGQGGLRDPLEQQAENEIMRQGVPLEVLANDDHAGHLGVIRQLYGKKDFDQWEQASVALVASHARKHTEMLVEQQQQGTAQGGANTANNVPANMGDMEGGFV